MKALSPFILMNVNLRCINEHTHKPASIFMQRDVLLTCKTLYTLIKMTSSWSTLSRNDCGLQGVPVIKQKTCWKITTALANSSLCLQGITLMDILESLLLPYLRVNHASIIPFYSQLQHSKDALPAAVISKLGILDQDHWKPNMRTKGYKLFP